MVVVGGGGGNLLYVQMAVRGRRLQCDLNMPVPTYDHFIEPILRYLAAHPEGAEARDVYKGAATALALSEAPLLVRCSCYKDRLYLNGLSPALPFPHSTVSVLRLRM